MAGVCIWNQEAVVYLARESIGLAAARYKSETPFLQNTEALTLHFRASIWHALSYHIYDP